MRRSATPACRAIFENRARRFVASISSLASSATREFGSATSRSSPASTWSIARSQRLPAGFAVDAEQQRVGRLDLDLAAHPRHRGGCRPASRWTQNSSASVGSTSTSPPIRGIEAEGLQAVGVAAPVGGVPAVQLAAPPAHVIRPPAGRALAPRPLSIAPTAPPRRETINLAYHG